MMRINDMARKDYYGILSIPEDADAQAIREAFRRLALQYHPDRNPDDEKAETRFKEINEAHEILSDPQQRDRYDQLTGRGPYRKLGGFGQDRYGGRRAHSDPPPPRNQAYRQQRYANRGLRVIEASELLAALCTMSLMIGIIMLVATWGFYKQSFGSPLWPTVPGKTISEEISGGVNYEYRANGQRYTEYARYPVDNASGWDTDVPVGSPVTVYYDPSDPANAVLEPGIDPLAVFCLAANIVVLSPGVLMIASIIRRRLRMSPGDWDGPFWPG